MYFSNKDLFFLMWIFFFFPSSIFGCLSSKNNYSACFHVRGFKTGQLLFLLSFIYAITLVPVTMASFSFQSQP